MKDHFRSRLSEILHQTDKDEDQLFESTRRLLEEMEMKQVPEVLPQSLGEAMLTFHSKGHEHSERILSRWTHFDREIGGFSPGEFVIIGSRPGMGKTQLLLHLALQFLKEMPVLFLSLDLSQTLLTSRIVSASTGIDNQKILTGHTSEEENIRIKKFAESSQRLPLYLYDGPANSMNALKQLCLKMKLEYGIKVIFIDYLQLLSSNRYRHNRESEIAYISRTLKAIARELNVLIIASSQLSRSVESRGGDKRPMLSDLRESGSLEQDADKVMFLYRPEYYGFLCDEDGRSTIGKAELIVAKNRMGPLSRIELTVDLGFSRFESFEESYTDIYISPDRLKESGLDDESAPF